MKSNLLISIFIGGVSVTTIAEAQETKPGVELNKAFEVNYGSAAWNQSATNIDSAFAFIKDKKTGKVVKVILDESEPDSSIFKGRFSISMGDGLSIEPEVFIPPNKMKDSEQDLKNFDNLLRQKKINRKPLLIKKNETNISLEIYDSKEQVLEASKKYKEEIKIQKLQKSLIKPITPEKTLQSNLELQKNMYLQKAALEAISREQERLRLEQLEKQKLDELLQKQKMLAEQEKQKRLLRAKELAEQAQQNYYQGNYKEAEALFKESFELDPANSSYLYKYGVTLYKNEKYNDALVYLKMSVPENSEVLEKEYYMGLTHFRLQEFDQALAKFTDCKTKKHPIISPSSAFYEGVILFNKDEFDKAQKSFEFVLDSSSDPKMDEKAENYIEKIARALQFKKLQEKKNDVDLTLGVNYDSNVLQSSNDSIEQGTATAIATGRTLISGNFNRRFVYTEINELSAKASTQYMYSLDSAAATADPFILGFSIPYAYKGSAFNKGYKLNLSPGYEILYLPPDSSSPPEGALNSSILNIDNTFVMSDTWFASYIIDIRNENYLTSISDPDDNQDGNKISIKTAQTYFFDKSKKSGLISQLGYTMNNTTGDNKIYNKVDLGVNYLKPIIKWDSQMSLGLSYYNMGYTKGTKRKDNNFSLTASLSKPLKEWLNAGFSASYTSNQSSETTYSYSKYILMATVTMNRTF